MVKVILIFCLAVILFSCQVNSKLFVVGLEDAIGAVVYIDGVEVGKMKRVGVGSLAKFSVRPGEHHIKVVNEQGKVFQKTLLVQGEYHLGVDFKTHLNNHSKETYHY